MEKHINKLKALFVSTILVVLTAYIGSYFTGRNTSTWYLTINRPFFLPPNYVFPIAWTILFILIGISFYLILTSNITHLRSRTTLNIAKALFIAQLVFNALWCYLFFEAHLLLISSIEIIVLEALICFTIIYFYKINKTAAYLLIPYALWVLFATLLTISVFVLN
jgi:tryptophan-rich sensory protein